MAGVVGFVGLDRLSLDMAALLLRAGYRVQAFEVQKLLMGEFLKLGGTECISLMETGKGVAALIVLISHADQINDVIFGHDDALKGLQKDKVIILHSTILPSYIQNLEKKLREDGLATSVVDAYVYKATSDNLNGKVVVMSSGRSDAISKARPFLSAMCEKLYIFEGETGAGSKIKLVTELLEGIHLMAAVEAISLGVHAGIHPWIIYDIISNAAGNSWVFKNYIPQLLRGSVKCHFLNPFILNLGIVLDMAKSLTFPLPLLATAHQQLVLGSSHGNGDDNTPLVQIWDQVYGVNTADAANTELYSPEQLASQIIAKSKTVNRVGFIGLGAMGFGMATHLVKSNFCVLGYDVYRPTLIRFESAGGLIGTSPADVSKDVDVLVVMVTNEAQAESVLYGDLGAVSALPSGASIILSSTVSPAFVSQLERRLQNEGKDLKLVDAPVSGGVKRASMGELTIMAAGSDDALKSSGLVLSVPHMLDNDYTPYSALDIFVKDLGIVARECSTRKVPLHISTMAHQLFLAGSAAGWGRQDDAGVVKVYETLTGVKVEGKLPALKKEVVLQSIPPEWPVDPINDIHRLNQKNSKTLVVLDDDPTGTQTVHDVEVLTEWSVESLVEQFRKKPICFFILTNSRSLSSEKATALIKDICSSLLTAAKSVGNIDYTVVLRGDSTLRGHFPEEPDAAVSVIGQVDAWILCPFFLQGGRYTIEDIHYVADSDWLVPAGDTEFAKDAAFGYKSSNLREWVEEKTAGRIPASSVASISIQLLRQGGPDAVCEHLCSLEKGSTCIVNAVSERDMAVFAAGMIQAELKGKSFLCRSAASFVSARIGIIPKARILPKDLGKKKERSGGLIVVGSYVPKTTKQVEELQSQYGHMLKSIEVSVHKVAMKSLEEREEEINRTAEMASVFLAAHKDTLIMSSRELITGKTASESLEINFKVSSALVEVVRRITTRPCYILAKGGITSSDLATKALEAKRAKVVGQALAGIPLWELGSESRHPGVPYIVFPGKFLVLFHLFQQILLKAKL
ncbi:Ketose-bisphosphate aldolase class-II family protein isoform 4 [Theobroma cacao]|uniref:Ketose-bisphosphate aldolase class-II family protein isoform 4 n=2 Tax=Theobroma cacao TaxID=3641 RepID=A0A061FUZ4_THECC|nr:Ketose-bisphosphate aldolase class-II family protein isoform 4 [Theobroma cacao]